MKDEKEEGGGNLNYTVLLQREGGEGGEEGNGWMEREKESVKET